MFSHIFKHNINDPFLMLDSVLWGLCCPSVSWYGLLIAAVSCKLAYYEERK